MSDVLQFKSNDIVHTIPDTTVQEIAMVVFWDQQSDKDIAAHFGMSKPTLYKLKRTSRFQTALKDFGEVAIREAHTKIQAASDKAVMTLVELMGSDTPAIKLKASIETLRLAGLGQPLPEFTPDKTEKSDKQKLAGYLQEIALNSVKATPD